MPETNYVLWAIGNLYIAKYGEPPFVTCDSGDPSLVDWMDTPNDRRFSVQEICAEIDRIKNEQQAVYEYRLNRSQAYPPIGDQLDALYHAGVFPEEMAAKIRAVKESFPKPDADSGTIGS